MTTDEKLTYIRKFTSTRDTICKENSIEEAQGKLVALLLLELKPQLKEEFEDFLISGLVSQSMAVYLLRSK